MNKFLTFVFLFPTWFLSLIAPSTASDDVVIRAVLFYSPSCGHCHFVITETLPPLFEKYGEQLYMVGVDVSQQGGQILFRSTLQYFNLESGGVPFLVIGDTYLVGSVDIPEKLPGLIEQYLAQGGVDFPPIPGLAEALAAPQPAEQQTTPTDPVELTPTGEDLPSSPTPTQAASATPELPNAAPTLGLKMTGSATGNLGEKFSRDLEGNIVAVIVLAGMLLSLGGGILWIWRPIPTVTGKENSRHAWHWLIPLLCVIGIGVAGYLAYVETAQVEAVCGPVGDCNTVQQSAYARLFGVLPIGVLGIAGYIFILMAWLIRRWGGRLWSALASLGLLGLTSFGLLFSIYLTFLEPFVIGATCAWCLASAILMTALFWLSLRPAKGALLELSARKTEKSMLS
jgi:uncharacterized membrane protein